MDQRIFDDMNNSDNIVEKKGASRCDRIFYKNEMLCRSVFQCTATLGGQTIRILNKFVLIEPSFRDVH